MTNPNQPLMIVIKKNKKGLTQEMFLGSLLVVILIFLYFAAGGTSGFYSIQNIMNIARVFSYLFNCRDRHDDDYPHREY